MTLESYRVILSDEDRASLLTAAKSIEIKFRAEIDARHYQLAKYYKQRLTDPTRVMSFGDENKLSKREEIICKLNLLKDMLSIASNQTGNQDSAAAARLLFAFVMDIKASMYKELFLIPSDAAVLLNATYKRLDEIFQIQAAKDLNNISKNIPF